MASRCEKHPEIVTRSELPLNAEPPLELLRQSFVGVIKLFYVRNHSSETVPAGQVSLRGYAITGGIALFSGWTYQRMEERAG